MPSSTGRVSAVSVIGVASWMVIPFLNHDAASSARRYQRIIFYGGQKNEILESNLIRSRHDFIMSAIKTVFGIRCMSSHGTTFRLHSMIVAIDSFV